MLIIIMPSGKVAKAYYFNLYRVLSDRSRPEALGAERSEPENDYQGDTAKALGSTLGCMVG